MTNVLIIAVVVIVVAAAAVYMYRAKKKGAKCIGCPASGNCSAGCPGCTHRSTEE